MLTKDWPPYRGQVIPIVDAQPPDSRYERGSMLVTSNRSVGEWGGAFGDAVVATAILDRLLHHSHVITIRGDSYRLRTKRRAGMVNQARATPATPTSWSTRGSVLNVA